MAFTTPSAVGTPTQAREPRYGTIAARVASQHNHQLGIDTPSARAGSVVHLIVQDVTRKPEQAKQAKWVCRHAKCAGKHWSSKDALLEEHPENRLLRQQRETHLYMAVYEAEAQPSVPEKRDDKGKILAPARDAQPAMVMLLSDED